MRVSLTKDPKSKSGDILVHVEVSVPDASPEFTYSHSFRYKVPKGNDGQVVVYADKIAALGEVDGKRYAFDLEKCLNKKCKGNGCLVILAEENRLLVADVFHTEPRSHTIGFFGTALFKALFSGKAGERLKETKPMDLNGRIFLQLNDYGEHDDLDAIPWEYAKESTTFLVHERMFTRVHERLQDSLPKLPLRIVVVAPDPSDLHKVGLADLRLGDQFRNFIDECYKNSTKVNFERVQPAAVSKMNSLLKHDKMATVLHFMGHCITRKDDEKARGLVFENGETYKCDIANTRRLITFPKNLRLAFLSACNSREIARDLVQSGVRCTIGSYCSLPDDIARKFEAQFYQFLAQGQPIDEAMWRARMELAELADENDPRPRDYLAGAMVMIRFF